MGQMLLACFSKANNHDVTSRSDINGRIWPWIMCSHIFEKTSKPLIDQGQNNLIKAHTPYSKDCQMKTLVNT
jgi:hypothetical protein